MKRLAMSPDRISALPEPIIHRILSFLPTESVKLASSLSKTWYDFCSSSPYLDFDNYFLERRYDDVIMEFMSNEDDFDPYLKPLRERYLKYISESLRRFHRRNPEILIRRIRIPITLINFRFVSHLSDCIQLALRHGVEKIDLKTRGYYYDFPGEVFASKSIQVLKLGGCSLLDSFRCEDISFSCSKLRKLVVTGVHINDLALRSVISNCPLMEKLAIEDAIGLRKLRISGHDKLKSLVVSNVFTGEIEKVEVDAPMLHCLEFSNNTRFGRPPIRIGILECPRLAKLTLSDIEVKNFQLDGILSRLPFLSSLRLTDLTLLKKLKISNDGLNQLAVIKCTHLVELEINAQNLLSFEFVSNSVPLVRPMHTIMGQSYITLDIGREPSLYENFAVKFRNFLSQLDRVNHLCLYLKDFAMISVDKLEERAVQPVTNIDELKIIVQISKSVQDIFSSLLWSFHPRILTMQLELNDDAGVLTFVRDITVGVVGSCCSWLPYLEEIKIVADNDNVIRLPMDGTVLSSSLKSNSYGQIKFAFKW